MTTLNTFKVPEPFSGTYSEFFSYMERLEQALQAMPEYVAAFPGNFFLIDITDLCWGPRNGDGSYELDCLSDPDFSAWTEQWKAELDVWFANPLFLSREAALLPVTKE